MVPCLNCYHVVITGTTDELRIEEGTLILCNQCRENLDYYMAKLYLRLFPELKGLGGSISEVLQEGKKRFIESLEEGEG